MKESDWAAIWGSEWDYVKRLGKAISDPEEKKSFWEAVKSKKLENPKYSIYDDFPPQQRPKTMAQKYCSEILEMIGAKRKNENE